MKIHPPPSVRLRPLLEIGRQCFAEGLTPGELELELSLRHGCNTQTLAEVVAPFRILHRDRTLQNGTYLSWWRQIGEDPLYTGAAGVVLLLITAPTTLWLAFSFATGIGFSEYSTTAARLVAVPVLCLGVGVSWVVGFPLFLLTRAYWQRRATRVRRWLAAATGSPQS